MENDMYRDILTTAPFFSGLEPALRTRVAELLMPLLENASQREGAVIFKAGDPGSNEGYILFEGEVSIAKPGHEDFPSYAPQLLGEMALFNPDRKRTATVSVGPDAALATFDWGAFHHSLEMNLSPDDFNAVKAGLSNYAWEHFMN